MKVVLHGRRTCLHGAGKENDTILRVVGVAVVGGDRCVNRTVVVTSTTFRVIQQAQNCPSYQGEEDHHHDCWFCHHLADLGLDSPSILPPGFCNI